MAVPGNAALDRKDLLQTEQGHLAHTLVADCSRNVDVPLEFSRMAESSKRKFVDLFATLKERNVD